MSALVAESLPTLERECLKNSSTPKNQKAERERERYGKREGYIERAFNGQATALALTYPTFGVSLENNSATTITAIKSLMWSTQR